ncbi:precorrin-2/cobalt-factor-2 C20-methyltransferase [Muricomes intestini]|uniref:Precorrin-2/cobalt-factor-2 C20-methyltransferase n=2 Tax=Muricomes intestini TaxID=1796634 RepID=A0A4R3K6J6_9FIRM|nr:precorrin-2/cobalt-factor-2 C20-methyltransferase [Muricomes intestini]
MRDIGHREVIGTDWKGKTMKQGVFYGIGVGPGDPELMTLKAVNTIRECDVLALAVSDSGLKEVIYEEEGTVSADPSYLEKCVAYQIALQVIPEIVHKAKLYLPMPMIKDKQQLKRIHDLCADMTEEVLREGKSIACITLGDPSIYSTCLYVHKRLKEKECSTGLIPGIPSFCAAAARLDIGLAENREELHIIPASYGVEESFALPGTKILMKAGKKMPYVKQAVAEKSLEVKAVENCGLPGEKVYCNAEEIPDEASYYSLIIIRETTMPLSSKGPH